MDMRVAPSTVLAMIFSGFLRIFIEDFVTLQKGDQEDDLYLSLRFICICHKLILVPKLKPGENKEICKTFCFY